MDPYGAGAWSHCLRRLSTGLDWKRVVVVAQGLGNQQLVGRVVGQLPVDQPLGDDPDHGAAVGVDRAGDLPHQADVAAAVDQPVGADGQFTAQVAGRRPVGLGQPAGRGAEHADRQGHVTYLANPSLSNGPIRARARGPVPRTSLATARTSASVTASTRRMTSSTERISPKVSSDLPRRVMRPEVSSMPSTSDPSRWPLPRSSSVSVSPSATTRSSSSRTMASTSWMRLGAAPA